MSLKLLLATCILASSVSGDCRESYATICDTFADFQAHKGRETINNLIIGSEIGKINFTSVNLMKQLQFASYYNLKTITVLRSLNKLLYTYGFQCTYDDTPLEQMIFYGNVFKKIEPYMFPLVTVKKLSLVNNKIEEIDSWSFRGYKIEDFDASDNLLEVIESESLPLNDHIKVITLKNNKITHIEPNTFHVTVERLHLDYNKMRSLEEEVLEHLTNLKELTVSNNNFNTIPKISKLKSLVILDFSNNAIETIKRNTFSDMQNLKFLDLTSNKISNDIVLLDIITPGKQPDLTISLALNRLRSLDLAPLQNQTLVLYGNAFDCYKWPELQKNLEGHVSQCDVNFLSKGSVPYCINYNDASYPFSSLWEKDVDEFRTIVRRSEEMAECTLVPNRFQWLIKIRVGCVA